ncbi:hypothetical protein HOD05_02975 [Candidatus Woesearchaeota archaeon]|jgi:site-specific DNA-methyltransferase (adenine-specific)|nr:hypothetical protein [Candidatus Woesearchaeota archaeon]MBT4151336.1 hypothetical protein [Candidatus Woesearchaeota archaeon]MBT4247427.1 hypothetical protein [Candidatus Woesearchaeota archaeon]MBT4434158.1 hypothetical protein [Candidatus Woesearchaeota archaeon]MBT7332475.1 hypothetical protein [Candidatus Woesearchaeota archaeon]
MLNKIHHIDVLKGFKKLKDHSVDIIIADPPYNIGKDFGVTIRKDLKEYLTWSEKWIAEATRVLKPTGTMYIYGFSEILAHLSVRIPLQKRWLIWHYTNKNIPSLNFWQRSHESIICCWKDAPTFNRDAVREPYTASFLNNAAGKVRKGTVGRFSKNGKETIYKAHKRGALPRDVLKVSALAGGAGASERWFLCRSCKKVYASKELKNHKEHDVLKHPTQKPMELTKRLLMSSKADNSVVLIPFAGSGSECVVAKKLGIDFIAFELNKEYVKLGRGILHK